MIHISKTGSQSAGLNLSPDEIIEFHAARLLLLVKYCGTNSEIEGLTKLAKLDFFVRYPEFFKKAVEFRGSRKISIQHNSIESSMIRYHYGPWDRRYYIVIPYLEASGLLLVSKSDNSYLFKLTTLGKAKAVLFSKSLDYESLIAHMKDVKKHFGNLQGSTLKRMIYDIFGAEVADLKLGELIKYEV